MESAITWRKTMMMWVTVQDSIAHGFWGGLIVFFGVLTYRIIVITTKLQKQIDDLKRELEEMKQKQSEPQS